MKYFKLAPNAVVRGFGVESGLDPNMLWVKRYKFPGEKVWIMVCGLISIIVAEEYLIPFEGNG